MTIDTAWQAIDDELVAIDSTIDSFASPKAALRALIDWHVEVALDPAVSSAAAALVRAGRNFAVHPKSADVSVLHQFRKVHCANWYDGHPDPEDGGGPYETRTLYLASAPAPAEPDWSDAVQPSGLKSTDVVRVIEHCAKACDEVASLNDGYYAGAVQCAKALRGAIAIRKGLDAEDRKYWSGAGMEE